MPLMSTGRRKSDTVPGRVHPFRQHSGSRFSSNPEGAPSIRVTLPPKPPTPAVPPRNPMRRSPTGSPAEKTECPKHNRVRSTTLRASSTGATSSRGTGIDASVHPPSHPPPPCPPQLQRCRSASLSFESSCNTEEPLRRVRGDTDSRAQVPPPLPPKKRHQKQSRSQSLSLFLPAKGKV